MKQPTKEDIKKARNAAGLTQAEAADVVHVSVDAWRKWEQGSPINLAAWELFLIKTAGEFRLSGVLTSGLIESQLTDKFGNGTQYSIITHDGMEPETGLMYGDDECIDLEGRLYQYFHPTDSDMVYRCFYTIPEGETDWSNIDYSDPDDVEVSDEWGYPE